jgi:hypothetical protein
VFATSRDMFVHVCAQLAAVGRESNTCVYVIAIFTMRESTEQRICIKFCFKIGKHATEMYELLKWAVRKCLTGSVDLKRVEPPLELNDLYSLPNVVRVVKREK